ncbi:MAG: SUMF1/EgtB/PvdO family nonheme iron enzyme [Candidatus Thermoplasmatota archaeon]|jgi:serine/threonine protein kinase|nr:SUMF1/EgtB/PvdO family nonheme iron enzyme [Candidatus Thermoplasmatota archaeon]
MYKIFTYLITIAPTTTPSDSFVGFLTPPPQKTAPDYVRKILPGFKITYILGSGGSADVYAAEDGDGGEIAIKIPHQKFDNTIDTSIYKRFEKEAEMWNNLDHLNIVNFYSAHDQPVPHISMELLKGGSLRSLMKNHKLTVDEAIHIMQQVLEGLSYAHRMAIVHRDLKPENILFTENGLAKITDWGIGKFMSSATSSKTVGHLGTMAYSAPEQFDKNQFGMVDWQTDIFQAGIMFYEMLTGANPFSDLDNASIMGKVLILDPEPPSNSNNEIPPALDNIVLGALGKKKSSRWRSADVMLFQLRHMITGGMVSRQGGMRVTPARSKKLSPKEQARNQAEKLVQRVLDLKEMGVDVSVFREDHSKVKRAVKMGWYEDAVSSGTKLLESLESLYREKMRERSRLREILRRNVKILFGTAFSLKIDCEHFFEKNLGAREALEEGDLQREEALNRELLREINERIMEHREMLKEKNKVRKLGEEISQLYQRTRIYGIELAQTPHLITTASSLLGKDRLREAKEAFTIAFSEMEKAIKLYEKAEGAKRRKEYRDIWEASEKEIRLKTVVYVKKLFVHHKEIRKNNMVKRKNFMGTPYVKIPRKNFYMARHTVTQREWSIVMGTAPWEGRRYGTEGDDFPVTYISWYQCKEFIKRLNEMEGVDSYRLPTEEEWEYACSAKNTTFYHFGDDEKHLGDYAWYRDNTWAVGEKYAHRVCDKKPNAWGLYDMHGNVWEWCEDEYDAEGEARVITGGSWDDLAENCRTGEHHGNVPEDKTDDVGFRLIRDVPRRK